MAAEPTVITAQETATTGPSGKTAGATTKAARKGAAEGGAVATLIAYLLVKTGLETNLETAVVVSGALATVLAVIVTHFQGKSTPTDQTRTEHHTETRTVVAPGPSAPPEGPIAEDGTPASDPTPEQPEVVPADVAAQEPRHRAEG